MGVFRVAEPANTSPAWRRRKEYRRAEILSGARACLEDAGHQGVSVETIGRRAGVSEATVYHYFGSKGDLMAAVIEDWMMPIIRDLTVDVGAAATFEAQLYVLARRHLTETRKSPRIHEIVYRELRWADYRGSAFHRFNQIYAGIFRDVFDKAVERGELAGDLDVLICRDLFYGGLEHLAQRTIFLGREIDIETTAETYARTILRAWRPAAAARAPDHAERLERAVSSLEALIGRSERLKEE